MKRPIWLTIVGVLAILFGIAGVFSGADQMSAPAVVELHQEVLEVVREEKPAPPTEESAPQAGAKVEDGGVDISIAFETKTQAFNLPDWYKSWALVIGGLSMIVAIFYFSSGVLLLMERDNAVKVFHFAITLSVIWVVLQSIIYIQTDSGVLIAQIPSALASVVIDFMLLAVVFFGRKVSNVSPVT